MKTAFAIERPPLFPGQALDENNWTDLVFTLVHFDQNFNLPTSGEITEVIIPETALYDFSIWVNVGGTFPATNQCGAGLLVDGERVRFRFEDAGKPQAEYQGKVALMEGQRVRAQFCILSNNENTSGHHCFSLVKVS